MTATGATSPATKSIVQTLGGGSGIDMAALASNLADASFAGRIDRNASRADTVERQISAVSTLKSQVLQLASSVGDRVRTGDLSAQPSISNAAIAAVSRGSAIGSGTYALAVTALAKAQVLTGPAFAAASDPAGSGTLTLRFGTLAGGTFSEDTTHAAVNVTIAAGATLGDVAAAISGAGAGVTAYVAKAADGAHLVIKGQEGAANAFVLEAAETPGDPGLSRLAWGAADDPARLSAQAANAAFSLDGLAMTSPTNTIADAAPGLSLRLTGTNPGEPATIGFSDPAAAVGSFMQDLTAALNELVSGLATATAPGGDLATDPGARALRAALGRLAGSAVMPGAAPGQPATLADLGLATNRDGTFRLDSARLAATQKAAPAAVAAMFTNGLHGVYATLDKLSRTATALGDPGSLGGSLTRYGALKTKLADEKTKLGDAHDALRAQLVSRFAAMDTRVGASRATLSFLQNQIAAWNAQKN